MSDVVVNVNIVTVVVVVVVVIVAAYGNEIKWVG